MTPWLIAICLTASALSWYLVHESGPKEILRRFRWKVGVNVIVDSLTGRKNAGIAEYVSKKEMAPNELFYEGDGSFFGSVFSCTTCMSFYTGLLTSLVGMVAYGIAYGAAGEAALFFPFAWGSAVGVSTYVNMWSRR